MKQSIRHIIIFLLLILWVYAAGSKLADVQRFAAELRLQPLPRWSVPIIMASLPVLEILAVVFLSLKATRIMGLLLSLLLLVSFTVYTGLAVSGGFGDIPCACGGVFRFLGWRGHLVFNAAASIAAAWALFFERRIKHTNAYEAKYCSNDRGVSRKPANE